MSVKSMQISFELSISQQQFNSVKIQLFFNKFLLTKEIG